MSSTIACTFCAKALRKRSTARIFCLVRRTFIISTFASTRVLANSISEGATLSPSVRFMLKSSTIYRFFSSCTRAFIHSFSPLVSSTFTRDMLTCTSS